MSILQFSEAKQFLTRLVRLMEQQKANGFYWWGYWIRYILVRLQN